jgi:hypothetical protein
MKHSSFLKKLWPGTWINSFLEFDKPEIFLPKDQTARKRYLWLINYPVTLGFMFITGIKIAGLFSSSVHLSLMNPDSFLANFYNINYLMVIVCFIWALRKGDACVKAKLHFDNTNQTYTYADTDINTNSHNNHQQPGGEEFQNNDVTPREKDKEKQEQITDNSKALYFSDFHDVEQMLECEFGSRKNIAQNLEKQRE